MASIEKRIRDGRTRWYARYRDPAGRQRTRTFNRRLDAERFLTSVESAKLTGTYIDPARARTTVGRVGESWFASKINLKPTTKARYRAALDVHVLPRWSATPLDRVEHTAVQAWIADLARGGQSGSSVRKAFGVLCAVLDQAVRERRLLMNPARGINLPPLNERRRRYLTAEQVTALANQAGTLRGGRPHRQTDPVFDQYRLVVLVLAYCGLRWSEVAALRVHCIDVDRRRLRIREAVTEINGGRLAWGTPKSHEARSVPVPSFLMVELARHVKGREPDDLVFTAPLGGVLRNRTARRDWFDGAAARIGVAGLTPHELRHTAASLAISAGANVKAVQRMLGHASAVMTLDRYADLFEDDLDEVAIKLDAIAREAGVYPACTAPSNNGLEESTPGARAQ
jgi:integrase